MNHWKSQIMKTFFEAVWNKYGLPIKILKNVECKDVHLKTEYFKADLKWIPEIMILTSQNIKLAGDPLGYESICKQIRRLDLSFNNLKGWNDILSIIKYMPNLEFLNVSWNLLNQWSIEFQQPPSIEYQLENISTLIMNKTSVDWQNVANMLTQMPNLFELHLCYNGYTSVDIDIIITKDIEDIKDSIEENVVNDSESTETPPSNVKYTKPHKGLKVLYLSSNPISDWDEINRLGRIFPRLYSLILMNCPLEGIAKQTCNDREDETACNDYDKTYLNFLNLHMLNLNNTSISSWDDVNQLSKFPKLKVLWTLNWPLWHQLNFDEDMRREMVIARLPNVTYLNGGCKIKIHEREKAERSFVKYYKDIPTDCPETFNLLAEIYQENKFVPNLSNKLYHLLDGE